MWTTFIAFTLCLTLSYRLFSYATPNKSDGAVLAAFFFAAAAVYMFKSAMAIVSQIMEGIMWCADKLGVPFPLLGNWTLFLFVFPLLFVSGAIAGLLLVAGFYFFDFIVNLLVSL
jgi:hypothetical protein